jgi:hypothetical protein
VTVSMQPILRTTAFVITIDRSGVALRAHLVFALPGVSPFAFRDAHFADGRRAGRGAAAIPCDHYEVVRTDENIKAVDSGQGTSTASLVSTPPALPGTP